MENTKCSRLDDFCYICGHLVPKKDNQQRKNKFTADFKKAYTLYFDEPDTSGEDFTPNTVCQNCYTIIFNWMRRKKSHFTFKKPVIWVRDPLGHDATRCYACKNFVVGLNMKKSRNKKYEAAFTASVTVDWLEGEQRPQPPPSPDRQTASTAVGNEAPQPLTQNDMDYIVAKLRLSQRDSEMLTKFLKRRKLAQQNVNSTSYRKRQTDFQKLYSVDDANTFTYCNDIPGLVNKLGMYYNADEWRLFIDGSVTSLKAVLLHKTNKKPSIPLGFGINMKETYETLGQIMEKIKYEEHKWKICCDLKVINILQGIIKKGGFPKYFCFLCNWDSRCTNQYQRRDWNARTHDNQDQLRLHNPPIIQDITDILLPPLHIKLGISGKLIEVVVRDVEGGFDCLKSIFPKLSDDKIKSGVLNGPDIRKLMKSEAFTELLPIDHLRAWNALKAVIEGVLGKNRVPPNEVKKRVDDLLIHYERIGASMTLKLHFLHFHLDAFLRQLPQESDEQGERFHQVTKPIESRFKGKKLDALLAEVCWWSSKISEYEDEDTEDPEYSRYEGHTEAEVPINPVPSYDSDDDMNVIHT